MRELTSFHKPDSEPTCQVMAGTGDNPATIYRIHTLDQQAITIEFGDVCASPEAVLSVVLDRLEGIHNHQKSAKSMRAADAVREALQTVLES